jgi:DNA-directed RNA polymerase specialized sigma24 family protein
MRNALFDTGDRKAKRPVRPPPTPHSKPMPPALTRAAIGVTLADALDGLPPERRAAIVGKSLFVLRPHELDCVARLVIDFIRSEA